jgi:uncharacterized protein (DUF1800 family)
MRVGQPKGEPGKEAEPVGRSLGSMRAILPREFGLAEARHLLWRAGFGGTPKQIALLAAWGPEKAVDHLLDPGAVEFEPVKADQFDRDILRPFTPDERRSLQAARRSQDEETLARLRQRQQEQERHDRVQAREIQRWWLTRMIRTPRPLEEKLTLFWHGHFATSYRTIENSYHMFLQNQTFRRHAIGSFANLLHAIIKDPAMLAYLDNNDSRKNNPNENLARELMELFGLGVGHYRERDIKEGARALTGYTFEDDDFVFRASDHDASSKQILGVRGNLTGEGFVNAILGRRACAEFIARKLYKFFVADVPDDRGATDATTARVLDDLAGALYGGRYQLRPLMRKMLLSEHFYHPSIMGQQIKSPAQLVVGAMRSLLTPLRDSGVLLDAMDLMGQDILFPPSVKGWDGGRSWINTSTLYVRQNILAFMITGTRPTGDDPLAEQEVYDPTALTRDLVVIDPAAESGLNDNPRAVIESLLRFTVGTASPEVVDRLGAFAAEHRDRPTAVVVRGLLLLITTMPEYQLC